MRWVSNEIQEDVGVGGWGYYEDDIIFISLFLCMIYSVSIISYILYKLRAVLLLERKIIFIIY